MIEVILLTAFVLVLFFATNGLAEKYGTKKSGTSLPDLDVFRDKRKKK